jgi:perosamine synthetase
MIPLLKPSCTDAEIEAVTQVLRSGWWGTGKVVEQFEQELAARTGYRYCVTTNSATAALHLAIKVLGIGPGDEVIVPALTFVSSGLAPLYENARTVLADIYPDTLCIDWQHVAQLTTGRTKAVIAVDYAGYPAKGATDLPVIQDAAHSCGGLMYGDLVTLSFHPVKNLATGDGGALLTNSEEYAQRARALRWCGIDRSTWERSKSRYGWDYDISEVGYKYHWNDIQAAIGLAQLRRIDTLNARRAEIATRYREALPNLIHPTAHPAHTWHLYPIRVPAYQRNLFIRALLDAGISAGVHYKPLTAYPLFSGDVPVTECEWRKLVSLPIFYDLTQEDQNFIISRIQEYWQ